MKNYLLTLLQQCSEEQFGQDAIEWAIVTGLVRLSYELEADVRSIMLRYDEIIEAYRRSTPQEKDEHRGSDRERGKKSKRKIQSDRPVTARCGA